jgi:hypothetical protein
LNVTGILTEIGVGNGWTRPFLSSTAYSSEKYSAPARTIASTKVDLPVNVRPGINIARPRHPTAPA